MTASTNWPRIGPAACRATTQENDLRREANPQLDEHLTASPQVVDPSREPSQGGDTGSNPVGTTRENVRVRGASSTRYPPSAPLEHLRQRLGTDPQRPGHGGLGVAPTHAPKRRSVRGPGLRRLRLGRSSIRPGLLTGARSSGARSTFGRATPPDRSGEFRAQAPSTGVGGRENGAYM